MRILLLIVGIILFFSTAAQSQLNKYLLRADSLSHAGEYKMAIELVNQVLIMQPRTFQKSQAYYQLSYIYLQLNDLEQAHYYNQQSLDLRDQISYEFIADNYMRFGTIALLQGRYETALDYYLEAKDLPHEDLQFSGILDGYLAVVYDRLGNKDLALENYKNSLDILEWAIGENTIDVAVAEYNLAGFYQSIEELDNSKLHYDRAAMIESELINEGPNPRHAKVLNALGWLVFEQTFDNDQAEAYFQQALNKSGGHRRMIALTRINLAQIYFNTNNLNKADKSLSAAFDLLNLYEETDFSYSIPMVLDKQLYARGLRLKAEIHLEQYNENQNIATLEKALIASSQAMMVFESKLMESYDENSQLQMLKYTEENYEQAIQIALQLFEKTDNRIYQEQAFQFAEKAKAVVLKNQMKQFNVMLSDRLPEALKKEEQKIRSQLTFFESEKAIKYEAGNFRKVALDLKRSYNALLKKIEKSAPEYYDLRYDNSTPSLMDLQMKLGGEDVILSYFMGKNLYYIFAIGRKDIEVYYTDQNAPLETSIKTELKDFNKKAKKGFPLPNQNAKKGDIPSLPKPDVGIYTQYTDESMDLKSGVDKGLSGMIKLSKDQFIAANHSLYRRLIEPVSSSLKGKKNLIIVPHDNIHNVIFETLLKAKPKGKAKYKKLKYLIKDYSIRYELSANFIRNSRANNDFSFAGFAPVFDPGDEMGYTLDAAELLSDTIYYDEEIELRSLVPDRSTFKKLEHSENELKTIIQLFAKKGKSAKAYFKKDATEERFKAEADKYALLHIASHSFVNPSIPKWSGIALAPDDSELEDGILLAGEVMNLNLKNTELVVLSSCESGKGEMVRGEGQLSLNRAFQYAGVSNTISTRWKITDKHSATLMKYFYSKLLSGANHADALRYAKLKFIKKTRTATPKLWAGFTLTGS